MTAKSGITQEELIKWGGADVFNQALALCNSGLVKSVNYDKDTLTVSGKIEQPDGWQMPVSFVLKENFTIFSNCPCYANQKLGQVCQHVVAIGIALMVCEMEESQPHSLYTRKGRTRQTHPFRPTILPLQLLTEHVLSHDVVR